MHSLFPRLLPLTVALLAHTAFAAPLGDRAAVPHLDAAGREGYDAFLAAGGHRAFAIAPGGAWAWQGDGSSAESVAEESLASCEAHAGYRCTLYALDDQVVFDARVWSGLWGPYADRSAAARARLGTHRGERFHDLALTSPAGKPIKLSALRGKVVVLHFWGSWCPSCRRELPELQRLRASLGSEVELVLAQVREEIAESRRWARQQGLHLPLYDSGAGMDERLPLAGGGTISDREVAQVFPTTYVLDKHGVVLFAHTGPISDWRQYLPLLRDVAAHSGR